MTETPPEPIRLPGAPRRFLSRAWRYSRAAFVTVAVLVVLLVGARLALPSVLRWEINRRLNDIPDYRGRVDRISVSLWRGAYAIHGLWIAKRAGDPAMPFVAARTIDFSLAWRELFHGQVVADIVIDECSLNFVKAATPQESQLEADRRWQSAIEDIFPINITYLKISNGHLHYIDRTADPVVDMFVDHLRLTVTGLRNRPNEVARKFPAALELEGDSIGHGHLRVSAQGEPLAAHPHFEASLTLENVSLPALNRFLEAFGKIDVRSGDFKLYLEIAARDGRFEGYAKPFFTDVKFSTLANQAVLNQVWRVMVGAMVEFLKNKPRDQLATRIPFAGEFGRTDIGFWATLLNLLRHGFVQALPTRLEHSVKSDDIPPPGQPLRTPDRPPGS